ncbi:MAG: hypothetical protein Q8O89_07345 [Nanoarchaeota archaeon]|nr:hypothetical protein [Nanoarchaeota archaeon]
MAEKTIDILVVDDNKKQGKEILGILVDEFQERGYAVQQKNSAATYLDVLKLYKRYSHSLVLVNGKTDYSNPERTISLIRMLSAFNTNEQSHIVLYLEDNSNGCRRDGNTQIDQRIQIRTSSDISAFVENYVKEKI